MLDIGGTELLVIALVLILVVGPKDLPRVLRSIGQFMAKMRGLTREFQSSIDEMAREADIADMRKELNSVSDTVSGTVTESNVSKKIEDTVDSTGELREALKKDDGAAEANETGLAKLAPRPDEGAGDGSESTLTATTSSEAAAVEPTVAAPEGERVQAGGAAKA